MSAKTGISWTDRTHNFLAGCSRKSPGCVHCYAERDAWRLSHNPNEKIARRYLDVIEKTDKGSIRWTGKVRVLWDQLAKPLSWRDPQRVFPNSNSDLFHETLTNDEIAAVIGAMAGCPHLTFQVLTKRADRMRDWWAWFCEETKDRFALPTIIGHAATMLLRSGADPDGADRLMRRCNKEAGRDNLFRNIHLGVSVENCGHGLPRIGHLRSICGAQMARPIPDPLRWLSIEPLLEDLGTIDLTGIGWVVVGGESGKHARPMHPDWVRSIRDQCIAAGVRFHFKQWGEWAPVVPQYPDDGDVDEHGCERDVGYELSKYDGHEKACLEPSGCIPHREFSDGTFRCDHQPRSGAWWLASVGKKRSGRVLDGREWNEFPGEVRP